MTREPNHWFRKTFDSGKTRRIREETSKVSEISINDPRVFPLTRSRVTPPPTPEQQARAEAFDECILIARLYEERGANAGAVRMALEAAARTPLEEAPQPGRATSGASSSGPVGTDGNQPSPPAEGDGPLTYEDWLGHITRTYDQVLRALGVPEPMSLKAVPRLRRVK